MGLRISIYRDGYNSTLNVFHDKREITLVNVEGPFEPTDDAPAALLVSGYGVKSAIIVPAENDFEGVQMFGGTFAATSDSRFQEAVRKLTGGVSHFAVSIHDRRETWAEYERYSL